MNVSSLDHRHFSCFSKVGTDPRLTWKKKVGKKLEEI